MTKDFTVCEPVVRRAWAAICRVVARMEYDTPELPFGRIREPDHGMLAVVVPQLSLVIPNDTTIPKF